MSNKPLKKGDENKAWNKKKYGKSAYKVKSIEIQKSFTLSDFYNLLWDRTLNFVTSN
jgi:hypothetical protein